MHKASTLGKVAYGFLFVIALPVATFLWAISSASQVCLPVLSGSVVGLGLSVIGLLLFLSGVVALYIYGKGLPMNAYPPKQYVTQGIYKFLSHPIYVGFCTMLAGASLSTESSSGFWLITPMFILGCFALVHGYEKEDMRRRFGDALTKPLISLPNESIHPPTIWNRLSVYVLVFLPWLIVYELFVYLGPAQDSFSVFLPFEINWPVMEWTEAVYASVYMATMLVPLFPRSQRLLREFALSGIFGTLIMTFFYIVVPVVATPRTFEPSTLLGYLLVWERGMDSAAAAFPSMHVFWAFLSATLYARRFRRWSLPWYAWAVAVAVSCLTTGMHALVDVVAGLALFFLVYHRRNLWQVSLRFSEFVANSWGEWRVGKLRLINHGFYAGLSALIGLAIVALLSPSVDVIDLLVVTVAALVMGDLVAQLIEGSSKLLRPFGYYGALIGAVCGIALTSWFLATPFWEFAGAFAVAAPFIQAIGRLRCLVQGCCHGRLARSDKHGIRYHDPASRVTRIAGLAGEPLYPTPLYSIYFNLVLGAALIRLWFLSVPLSLLTGIYFLLSGIERFVEESYRGEPQTPLFGNLHIYQWLAIASAVVGAIVTGIESSASHGSIEWHVEILIPALMGGLLATFAMGVDFPQSSRRFARLTS